MEIHMPDDEKDDLSEQNDDTVTATLPKIIQDVADVVKGKKKIGRPKTKHVTKGAYLPSVKNQEVTKAAEIKESFFKAFEKAGGIDRLVRVISEVKLPKNPTQFMKDKKERQDRKFLEFAFKVLPALFPKKTELDIERRTVIFKFSGGKVEKFESEATHEQEVEKDESVDAEIIKEEGDDKSMQ